MDELEILKDLIDEANYPYFSDHYLISRLAQIDVVDGVTLNSIARNLCLIKSGIEEMKLGDITIPSPRNHFLVLASRYRDNLTGVVTRIDEQYLL